MNALDVMLGTPPGTHRAQLASPGAIPHPPAITAMGTPADLLRRRPDIIVAERHLAASNARIGVAVSEYYPKFSLTRCLAVQQQYQATIFSLPVPASRQVCWGYAGGSLTLGVLTRK
jgi:outer membrane protein TolC